MSSRKHSSGLRGLKRTFSSKVMPPSQPRQAHPDSVVTTNIDVSSWAARVLERKRAAGEALSPVQVALASRIVPRAAVVVDVSQKPRSVFISKKFGGGAGQLSGGLSSGAPLSGGQTVPVAPAVHGPGSGPSREVAGVVSKLDVSLDALIQNNKRRRV